jgi:5,10-methylenetetrahydrofolate reductase
VGLRQAEFFASEVIGISMPDALLARLRAADDEAAEAAAVTNELVTALRDRVQGLQITVLHGSPAAAEALLATLRSGHARERKRHHA